MWAQQALVASLSISLEGENGPLWTIIGLESENSGPGKGDQGEEDRVTNRKIMMVLKYLCHRERQNALKKHIMSHLVLLGLRQLEVVGQSCRQVSNLLRTSADFLFATGLTRRMLMKMVINLLWYTKKDDQRNLVPTVGGKRQRL